METFLWLSLIVGYIVPGILLIYLGILDRRDKCGGGSNFTSYLIISIFPIGNWLILNVEVDDCYRGHNEAHLKLMQELGIGLSTEKSKQKQEAKDKMKKAIKEAKATYKLETAEIKLENEREKLCKKLGISFEQLEKLKGL